MDRTFPWGCEGATWLDHDGYPYYHEEATTPPTLHSDNFHDVEDCAVAGAENSPRETSNAVSLNAANQKLKYPWTGPFKVLDVTKDRNTARIAGTLADSI